MLFFDGALALVAFAVWIFCLIDVITTPEGQCRNLPKLVWLLLVIVLADVGSIAWLLAGRNWNSRLADIPDKAGRGRRPSAGATNPDDDEEFLAELRVRAEEQRRRARDAQQRGEEPPAPS
jgi:hypothetical protein